MKIHLVYCLLFAGTLTTSCSPGSGGLFSKKTQHEKYADKLDRTDLDQTPAGREWLAAARSSLEAPQKVSIPYKMLGHFPQDKPRALGLGFTASRGQRISLDLRREPGQDFVVYADLFKADGESFRLLLSGDTNISEFHLDIEESGDYILRLQPEIERTGSYRLSITSGPSLTFPVAGKAASIGSFWGDARDAGKRRHEGIDIFAAKRTPVIAAADGYVTGVKEGGIGGKTVWLRVRNKDITLYYAHLDEQLVRQGQQVKQGDTIGLVGNTGNARSTPPHLHFGIYTRDGAENPLSFVDRSVKKPPSVPDRELAGRLLRLKRPRKTAQGVTVSTQTGLVPLAVTPSGYIAELPDGQRWQLPSSSVKTELMKKDATAVLKLSGAD